MFSASHAQRTERSQGGRQATVRRQRMLLSMLLRLSWVVGSHEVFSLASFGTARILSWDFVGVAADTFVGPLCVAIRSCIVVSAARPRLTAPMVKSERGASVCHLPTLSPLFFSSRRLHSRVFSLRCWHSKAHHRLGQQLPSTSTWSRRPGVAFRGTIA